MGREARCRVTVAGGARTARVQLETSEIIIHGTPRLKLPFAEMTGLAARDGVLSFRSKAGAVRLELGEAAPRWLETIRNPKPRVDKLGVKPGMSVIVTGLDDVDIVGEIEARSGVAVRRRLAGRADIVLLGMTDPSGHTPLAKARAIIAPDGMIWVVWPKGRREFGENHIRRMALDAGLVDVKVAAFSPTNSALKLVIPVAKRIPRPS